MGIIGLNGVEHDIATSPSSVYHLLYLFEVGFFPAVVTKIICWGIRVRIGLTFSVLSETLSV